MDIFGKGVLEPDNGEKGVFITGLKTNAKATVLVFRDRTSTDTLV